MKLFELKTAILIIAILIIIPIIYDYFLKSYLELNESMTVATVLSGFCFLLIILYSIAYLFVNQKKNK
ncbi:MAG: hypothetical protein NTV74_02475 [Euryarchaeota archaeon]|nr:hypothetical protein [Euryarchaeota archaeon]